MAKILVIDDEESVLDVLSRFLIKLEYEVDTAENWEMAQTKFESQSYDLIILDVHMPDKDGFQVATQFKVDRPGQKILMITGLGAGEVYQYFSKAGVDMEEILYKPFSMKKVKNTVARILKS